MIAIIFEVWPREGGRDEYLDIAASLRPDLEAIDGFVSVERFQSLSRARQAAVALLLSRRGGGESLAGAGLPHRRAQAQGRGGLFDDYRLRVAEIVRDYGLDRRDGAPVA